MEEPKELIKDGTIFQFLMGSHSYEGVWFGERHPKHEGSFWWRKHLTCSEDFINQLIRRSDIDANKISDKYHTFGELYEHRITIFIALCKVFAQLNESTLDGFLSAWIGRSGVPKVWRARRHSDGSEWDGWFILGLEEETGKQITYHLPMSKWDECGFAVLRDKAPEYDGHTSADVLDRLKALL